MSFVLHGLSKVHVTHSHIFIFENYIAIAFRNLSAKYISNEKQFKLSYHNYVANSHIVFANARNMTQIVRQNKEILKRKNSLKFNEKSFKYLLNFIFQDKQTI